jgi:hypothetical protein
MNEVPGPDRPGEDKIRPYIAWYVDVLGLVAQAINDGDDVGRVIREAVDELSDTEARNALQVMIGHHAQQAVEHDKRKSR